MEGRRSLILQKLKGRPLSQITQVNVNAISLMTGEDRHLTTGDLEHMTNISKLTIHNILTQNIRMRRLSPTWVSHFLICEQMATHVEIREEWLEALQEQPDFSEKVIMCDESCVQCFEPLTRQGSAHNNLQRVFDSCRFVYQHCVTPKTTINKEYY